MDGLHIFHVFSFMKMEFDLRWSCNTLHYPHLIVHKTFRNYHAFMKKRSNHFSKNICTINTQRSRALPREKSKQGLLFVQRYFHWSLNNEKLICVDNSKSKIPKWNIVCNLIFEVLEKTSTFIQINGRYFF